jgi:hypothetical protein
MLLLSLGHPSTRRRLSGMPTRPAVQLLHRQAAASGEHAVAPPMRIATPIWKWATLAVEAPIAACSVLVSLSRQGSFLGGSTTPNRGQTARDDSVAHVHWKNEPVSIAVDQTQEHEAVDGRIECIRGHLGQGLLQGALETATIGATRQGHQDANLNVIDNDSGEVSERVPVAVR